MKFDLINYIVSFQEAEKRGNYAMQEILSEAVNRELTKPLFILPISTCHEKNDRKVIS